MNRILLLVALLLVALEGFAVADTGPKALESRLYAPCCYGGTLDTHDSELARSLREEIESRWAHGETSDAIQADMVARYGEKVLAARSDAPIRSMTVLVASVLGVAAIALLMLFRRWTRRPSAAGTTPQDALDERIDAELARLD